MLSASCNIANKKNKATPKQTMTKSLQDSTDFVPDNKTEMYNLADTLYYTAQIKPANEEEAIYMTDWVKNLKRKEFTDLIFNAVLSGKLKAYHYGSDEKMSIREVKKLRKENINNEIGKILFEEAWYFDDKNMRLYKKVNSIMLAYERKDEDGNTKGYKSGIKVYLNN